VEDKEGKPVRIVDQRLPKAFGVFIEYEYPDLESGATAVSRSLWVIYDAGTGDYPLKAFLAPTPVAEKVASMLPPGAPSLERPVANIIDEIQELLKKHTYSEAKKIVRELRERGAIPSGVDIRRLSEERHPHPP
jgi:hypothetical protein